MPGKDTAKEGGGRRFRIFLSSTSRDLKEHRARVTEAIEGFEQQAARMETFGAMPSSPLEVCRQKARTADAVVVLVAHRYGWVPSTEEGGDGKTSITRYEVEAALGADPPVPVFAFLVDPSFPWSGPREELRLSEAKTDDEVMAVAAAVRGLKDFRDFLESQLTRKLFTTPDDLVAKVATSLFPWLVENVLERQERGDAPPPPVEPEADLTSYLEALIDRTDHIDIKGIATHVKGALRYPIERLYTPLTSRGELAEEGASGLALRHERMALADLLPRHDRLLIEGQPGAGKTTFLRFTACMLARDLLSVPCPDGGTWRGRHLGLDGAGAPKVPVFLRVSKLAAFLTGDDAPRLRHDNRQWLLDLLARSCEEDAHPVPRGHWQKLFESGEAILLLDGLDEAAEASLRERIFRIFRDACRRWKCPVVVSSRPIDTAAMREMGFHLSAIEPFADEEIRTFIDHWVAALHAIEADTPEAAERRSGSGEARRYAEELSTAIVGRSRVRRLATNPVMLTCLCVVHWNEGQLPEGRSRVYRAVVEWLLKARSELRAARGFSDLFARRALARLALDMMRGEGGKRAVVDVATAVRAIEPLLEREFPDLETEGRRLQAREWLDFECLWSGILEEVAGRRLRFWHLTFEEFLAALQLAWRGDGEDPDEDWWPVVREHLDDAQWRETLEMLPGCLLDEGGVGRVDRLFARVLALRTPEADLATEARIAGVLGRLLPPLEVLDYKPSPEISAAYEQALDRSLEIFAVEGASRVPVEPRIEAAEALGRGGDPRLAPGTDNLLEVPGLGGKRLGKYPVTVEEYQRFVEGRGYEEPQHWSDDAWAVKEKEAWEAPGSWPEQLEHPSRPVIEVSWYDADAYCRWLSAQRGVEIRLPSVDEWYAAAEPAQGEYPWGKEKPDPERANFVGNVGAPTPVGVYPAGDGRYEHCDLAGNVWEWSQDEYEPSKSDREILGVKEGEPFRVLRGGGWSSTAGSLRAAARHWYPASDRSGGIGFRVMAAPSSTLKP